MRINKFIHVSDLSNNILETNFVEIFFLTGILREIWTFRFRKVDYKFIKRFIPKIFFGDLRRPYV